MSQPTHCNVTPSVTHPFTSVTHCVTHVITLVNGCYTLCYTSCNVAVHVRHARPTLPTRPTRRHTPTPPCSRPSPDAVRRVVPDCQGKTRSATIDEQNRVRAYRLDHPDAQLTRFSPSELAIHNHRIWLATATATRCLYKQTPATTYLPTWPTLL